ncbi:B12-binding domain-containing radical SAM protein [Streptosporangium sp. NPDC049376]|uniref:B12-binding domain-containing radical SAM protein n=1 Tax=Streptosporangium sp. NPDC049376 TaxID=3366192 RepID=UPI003796DFB2
MKILLSTSPHVRHPAVLQSDFRPHPSVMYGFAPVGLLSLMGTLRAERPGVGCELYDLNRRLGTGALAMNGAFYAEVADDICGRGPTLVGFMTECDSYHHVLQVAQAVKATSPDTGIVLGGPHASAVAAGTMATWPCVDAIVIGEGERTFLEVADSLREPVREAVPGAIVRRTAGGGECVHGGPRALIGSLDDLALPAFDVYRPDPGEELFIEVGRGCPFQCRFCSTAPYWQRKHRVKSPDRILQEVSLVRDLYGTTRVHFTHDLFTTNRAWVRDVCAALVRAGRPVRWTCSARTDTVDRDLLETMADAGCSSIYFGIESGSPRILKEIRKAIPLSVSLKRLRECREVGITPNAGFIVGFPSEDAESVQETFAAYESSLRLGARPTHLFVYCPFADSSMYGELESLECDGHFVDLPLGAATDEVNRRLIQSDPHLFGSYFRPVLPDLVPGAAGALGAMDEFSPLVEAALAPALEAARLSGGMYALFRKWLTWIQARNEARLASAYRLGYGTPHLFATFLTETLAQAPDAAAAVRAAAEAIRSNLAMSEEATPAAAITMASHRSVVQLRPDEVAGTISLDAIVSLGSVLKLARFDHDVVPALLGELTMPPDPSPTFLVWQRVDDTGVRLLQINRFLFDALERLRLRDHRAEELLLATEELSLGDSDAVVGLRSLASAAAEGLVQI